MLLVSLILKDKIFNFPFALSKRLWRKITNLFLGDTY